MPLCTKFGLGILPWSPLSSGLLTGKYRRGQTPPEGTRLAQWQDRYKSFDNERNWRVVEALLAVASELDQTPSQVALAWLLARPAVSSVIFGARTVAQLDDNLGAADLTLSADVITRLDAASAPEFGYPYDFIKNIDGAW